MFSILQFFLFYFPCFFHRLTLYYQKKVQPPLSAEPKLAQLSRLFYISNADHIINPVVTHFLTGARASTSLQLSSEKMWISLEQSCSSAAETCSQSISFKYIQYVSIKTWCTTDVAQLEFCFGSQTLCTTRAQIFFPPSKKHDIFIFILMHFTRFYAIY